MNPTCSTIGQAPEVFHVEAVEYCDCGRPVYNGDKECRKCATEDIEFASSCCGATASMMEYGICPVCKDHCEFTKEDNDGNVIETYQP